MIVFRTGLKEAAQPKFVINICPGRHLEGQELASEFVDGKNQPIEMQVEFKFGAAHVSDAVGKYMLKYGLASKTRLVIPPEVVVV